MTEHLLALLRRMEELIDNSGRVPLSGKIIVPEDDIYDLIDALKESLPREIEEALRIVREREAVLDDARKQAEDILRDASSYVDKLASESNVVKRAEEQAEQYMADARKVAQEINSGTREYADDLLKNVQGLLEQSLTDVKRSRQELKVRKPMGDTEKSSS